jgi:hypothetical protein
MRQELASLQCRFASLDRFDEAVFFHKVTGDNFLNHFLRIATTLSGASTQARFKVGVEMDFHVMKIRERKGRSNIPAELTKPQT